MSEPQTTQSRRSIVGATAAASGAAAMPLEPRNGFAQRASFTAAQMKAAGATAKIETPKLWGTE